MRTSAPVTFSRRVSGALVLKVALILLLAALMQVTLLSQSVTVNYLYPNSSTILESNGTQNITSGGAVFYTFGTILQTVVTSTSITITNPTGISALMDAVSFDGPHYLFPAGTAVSGVAIDASTNVPGFDMSRITFSGTEVLLNLRALYLFPGFNIKVNVSTSPGLKIAKSHLGNFFQGQQGAAYSLTVSNSAGAPATSGTVTVTDTLPSGLALASMAGTGWSCTANVCTRSDALAAGASYPIITLTVNVSGAATSPQVNQASVSGGGSPTTNASDSTIVGVQPTLSVNRNVLNFGIAGTLITSPQTVLVTFSGGANVAWAATSNHSNITVTPSSGVGTGTFNVSAAAGLSGVVTVTSAGAKGSPQTIQVNITNITPAPPFGSFDTPINGTTGVIGAIPVTGWALDNIEVTHVDIFREPVAGEPPGNLVPIGTAIFSADARPDVAAASPLSPFQYRAGWGYQMLTNFLPNASGSGAPGNGTYKLHAIAFDAAGMQVDLGTRAITVDNAHATKPFGTIDTPIQGGTIFGADSVNFGWALTPQPGLIPKDGSTITVVIDGVAVGHPVYNQFRSDIATLFPGYGNSGGAVGFVHINTTTLANGVHTISWNVFDNLNRGEGLGSRYFNVLNTGTVGGVAALEDTIDESAASEGVRLSRGGNVKGRHETVVQDSDGGYSVEMEEVGLIELNLGAASGNMLVEGEARALPTGSTLKRGVFYWQPGPGFLGVYTMKFTRLDGTAIPVRVKIVPKRFSDQTPQQ